MKSLSERLREAMEVAGITQAQLAQLVGVSQPAINRLVTGKTTSSRKIVDIARVLSVNPEWLTDGSGSMNLKRDPQVHPDMVFSPEPNEREFSEPWDRSKPLYLDEVIAPFLGDIDQVPNDGMFKPRQNDGMFVRIKKDVLSTVGANAEGEGVLCFLHSGNSMEPFIPDGSRIVIDCNNKKIIDGKVYVINQGGWKRLRMLYRSAPDKVTIRSFNSETYPDEEVNLTEVEVIGRMFMTFTLW